LGIERLPTADSGDGHPRPLNESLNRVVRFLGAPDVGALTEVFGRWETLVGEQVAVHSRPVSLHDRTLVIAVDDPAWASQIRWLESRVLERLASQLGADAVDRIQVRVDPSLGAADRS
jgi:predicted nucleic acid-binding Zn ribbon protein